MIPDELQKKYDKLLQYLKAQGAVAVAFSGGVDSTFLLKAAQIALEDQVLALTADSQSFPGRELSESEDFCRCNGIRQQVVSCDQMEIEGFRQNPADRCYLCKKALFSAMLAEAAEKGIDRLAEGSNMDDMGDYRPGMKAIAELGVLSPLRYAELTKQEIRLLSRELGLPTWSKPSYACLATRFAYGETITDQRLSMVDQAEQLLLDLGFTQMRVRIHGKDPIARIEVEPDQISLLMKEEIRRKITQSFRQIGFSYVTLDLDGYRTGSMNETIPQTTGNYNVCRNSTEK